MWTCGHAQYPSGTPTATATQTADGTHWNTRHTLPWPGRWCWSTRGTPCGLGEGPWWGSPGGGRICRRWRGMCTSVWATDLDFRGGGQTIGDGETIGGGELEMELLIDRVRGEDGGGGKGGSQSGGGGAWCVRGSGAGGLREVSTRNGFEQRKSVEGYMGGWSDERNLLGGRRRIHAMLSGLVMRASTEFWYACEKPRTKGEIARMFVRESEKVRAKHAYF